MVTFADREAEPRRPQPVHGSRPDGRRAAAAHAEPAGPLSVPAAGTAAWEGRPVFGLWPRPIDWGRITDREREVYEVGFMNGFFLREDEVAQANADADRLYRVAFDRQYPRRR